MSTSTPPSSVRSKTYCKANPQSATGPFVLAYHYLTEGFTDAAVTMLKQVGRAQAERHALGQAAPAARRSQGSAGASAERPAAAGRRRHHAAGRRDDRGDLDMPARRTATSIADDPAREVRSTGGDAAGPKQHFAGTSTYGNGILTLAQEKGPAMVGRVSWKDVNHVTFRVVGDGPDSPGLSFAK